MSLSDNLFGDGLRNKTRYRNKYLTTSVNIKAPKEWKRTELNTIKCYTPIKLAEHDLIDIGKRWFFMLKGAPSPGIGAMTSLLAMHLTSTQDHKINMFEAVKFRPEQQIVCEDWRKLSNHSLDTDFTPLIVAETFQPVAEEEEGSEYKTTTSTNLKDDILDVKELRELSIDDQKTFFCYLAFCLMRGPFTRIENMQTSESGQLKAILENFTNFYGISVDFLEPIRFSSASLNMVLKKNKNETRGLNTVLMSAILVRGADKDDEGLLDFGLLQRAAFTGMHMYSLLTRSIMLYKVQVAGMLELLSLRCNQKKILELIDFIDKHEGPNGAPDKDYGNWQWARALSASYFMEFQTKENLELGYTLACIVARKESGRGRDPREIVPFEILSLMRKRELQLNADTITSIILEEADTMPDTNVFATAYNTKRSELKGARATTDETLREEIEQFM
jgi:hypothetical protein